METSDVGGGHSSRPDFSVAGFFLWGNLKAKGCDTGSSGIPNFEQSTRQCIEAIPNGCLLRVLPCAVGRVQECTGGDGDHLKM
jgi:hypothetical protein